MIEENKEVTKRDLVSWRINKLSDFESLNKWVNAQGNIQISLTTLVRHIIDQFGYRDITDIDIQKAMFLEPYFKDFQTIIAVMDDFKKNSSNFTATLELDSHSKNTDDSKDKVSAESGRESDSDKDPFYSSVDASLL
ncbi:hypothetical protein GC101_27615 [Paenibacillus sp. LMG 31459]|uniref:Uncharacterized protein n=1 Tax=Paenibacillus phytohabitans TaxID=2654978 RepID=A0ABX1YRW7_9BACL|nr:hypothetical protein [Paenibacillus phytohabitans]NOU82636.1 hypothetical protein [Paenibacillus phytohabitans]